jgi:hypothetical protein
VSVPLKSGFRHYPTSVFAGYASPTVGAVAEKHLSVEGEIKRGASSTVRETQSRLLRDIWNIPVGTANWDDEGAEPITPETSAAAIQLVCALPEGLPPPEVAGEPTGEISFEWYKDSRHVAVVTIQDGVIRWSAILGTGAPLYGREPFSRTVPGPALQAIETVIA